MKKEFWKNIWDEKGTSESNDLLYLCGWEHLDMDISSETVADGIKSIMGIESGDSVLEIACGAGFLSREFQDTSFSGVDYSEPLICKHKTLFPTHDVQVCESNSLPFEDDAFNKVFANGLFQYLPDLDYALETISEMSRVATDSILLSDLKSFATRDSHLIVPKKLLKDLGFQFSSCTYRNDTDNYNAYLRIKGAGRK